MATQTDLEPLEIPPGKYYTKAQIAKMKGVNATTVNYWIRHGWLPAIRIANLYLIPVEAYQDFVPRKFGPRFMRRG